MRFVRNMRRMGGDDKLHGPGRSDFCAEFVRNLAQLANKDFLHLRMQMHFRLLNKNQMGGRFRIEGDEVLKILSQEQKDQDDISRSESVIRLGQVYAV